MNGPLGARRFDIVTRDANGLLHGIEIKIGGASPTLYQQFTDKFVNMFGVSGTGRFDRKTISTATTVAEQNNNAAAAFICLETGVNVVNFEPEIACRWWAIRV